MKLSKHTEIRQQQRGIKDKTINLLFKEGKQIRQKGGTAILVFPKSKKPEIEKKHLKIKNIKNAYIVIEVDEKNLTDSPIITTGHDYKNIHKKSHRNFHRKSNKKFH
tara:strand:- start:175 stop:495 length:321 start_codon:yes stop_codon:yes gene_type:complete